MKKLFATGSQKAQLQSCSPGRHDANDTFAGSYARLPTSSRSLSARRAIPSISSRRLRHASASTRRAPSTSASAALAPGDDGARGEPLHHPPRIRAARVAPPYRVQQLSRRAWGFDAHGDEVVPHLVRLRGVEGSGRRGRAARPGGAVARERDGGGDVARLRVIVHTKRTSGWSSKASGVELKGVEVCRD